MSRPPRTRWPSSLNNRGGADRSIEQGEFPTNTLVEIRALAEPSLDVEIEATVLLDS